MRLSLIHETAGHYKGDFTMRSLACAFLAFLSIVVLQGRGAAEEQAKEVEKKVTSAKIADNDEVASAIRLLEAWIESQMAYRGMPGLSIAIVHDQDLVWAKGFGYADMEKKVAATPA